MESLMPLIAPQTLAQNLHETNARLGLWLDSLVVDSAGAAPQARAATPQQMAGLLSELMRAGEWLRDLPVAKDEAVEQELSVYRKNVERLRDLLPAIHGALLRERVRLEQERARVESAAEWARGSRQTL
jgi:ABC-type nitrate/sulfonate/bicarbonate transport system substrate-binding protein